MCLLRQSISYMDASWPPPDGSAIIRSTRIAYLSTTARPKVPRYRKHAELNRRPVWGSRLEHVDVGFRVSMLG
jgi:hypothetical protein